MSSPKVSRPSVARRMYRAWCCQAAVVAMLWMSQTLFAGQPPRVLTDASADIKAGRYGSALKRLDGLEPTEPVLTLRIEASVGLQDTRTALAAYEDLVKPPRKEQPALAVKIATAVLTELSKDEDPTIQLEACSALAHSTSNPCRQLMEDHRRNPATPFATRLGALATLAAAGDAAAGEEFKRLAAGAQGMTTRSIPNLAVKLPKPLAVSIIARLLDDPDKSMQFAAASALGQCGEVAKPTLEAYLKRLNPRPLAPGAAQFALITLGDREAVVKYAGPLEALRDEDAFVVGTALARSGDPRGATLIKRAAASDNDMLRVRSAAKLGTSDVKLVKKILDQALASQNIWIRTAALKEFRGSSLLTFPAARGLMSDPETWVRLRAAEAVVAAASGTAQPGKARALPAKASGKVRK